MAARHWFATAAPITMPSFALVFQGHSAGLAVRFFDPLHPDARLREFAVRDLARRRLFQVIQPGCKFID